MRNLVCVLFICCLCNATQADVKSRADDLQPVVRDTINLRHFSVSKAVPKDSALSHCLYGSSSTLTSDDSVPESIALRERDYSWYWMRKAVYYDFLPRAELQDKISLCRKIDGKDDGAFLAYSIVSDVWTGDRVDIEVIDARLLTVLITKEGSAKSDVAAVAKKFINYRYGSVDNKLSVSKRIAIDERRSYGVIEVDCHADGWYAKPIEWYRDGDSTLLVFQKIAQRTKTIKIVQDTAEIVGGCDFDYPRPFLRFEHSNRAEIAKEYVDKCKY